MTTLHLVQGGIDNGDMKWLLEAARRRIGSSGWNVPKAAQPGDEVVIYVLGHGLFATAAVVGPASPRKGWYRRYSAPLGDIRLIQPPVSLGVLRRAIPALTWARYPRSLTTPSSAIASRIRTLIERRRRTGAASIAFEALPDSSLAELRAAAIASSRRSVTGRESRAIQRRRSEAIRLYVLRRANGVCEGCAAQAPFRTAGGLPYLEPHHTTRLADGGPDHPAHVIGLCPNCHRRAHLSADAPTFQRHLKKRLASLESRVV